MKRFMGMVLVIVFCMLLQTPLFLLYCLLAQTQQLSIFISILTVAGIAAGCSMTWLKLRNQKATRGAELFARAAFAKNQRIKWYDMTVPDEGGAEWEGRFVKETGQEKEQKTDK